MKLNSISVCLRVPPTRPILMVATDTPMPQEAATTTLEMVTLSTTGKVLNFNIVISICVLPFPNF